MKIRAFNARIEIDEGLIAESEKEIRRQTNQYLEGEREAFDLTISFPNSFTGKVMKEMSRIPYGQTKSYGDIAEKLDSAAIAVGQTCGRNPLPTIIPCHRVVGKDSLGGYSLGLGLKRKFLNLEGVDF